MKKTILIIAATLFTIALSSSCKKPIGKCTEFFEKDCEVDATYYKPVCGCNDKTYANETYAKCAQVEYEEGSCPD